METDTGGHEQRVPIRSDDDIVTARQQGRAVAADLGFTSSEVTLIITAISEVARNILQYAIRGEIIVKAVHEGGKRGVMIVAPDKGPGISDLARAMEDGFSTGGGLGLGLPGAKRMMDEFEIASSLGKGTTVTMKKWVRARG